MCIVLDVPETAFLVCQEHQALIVDAEESTAQKMSTILSLNPRFLAQLFECLALFLKNYFLEFQIGKISVPFTQALI
jgi:hypothetical protein